MQIKISIIFILILAGLTIYLGLTIASRTQTKIIPRKIKTMPALYVDGSDIKRSDTGRKVVFKGVAVTALTYEGSLDSHFTTVLETIRGWGINFIGIYIEPDILDKRAFELDYLIEWAERNHLYVFIFPRPSEQKDVQTQLEQFPTVMENLAKKYADKKNILYGLGTEPNMSWEKWYSLAHRTAMSINKSDPEAVLIMTGTEFGRYINFDQKLPLKNIIYDYHEYPAKNIKDLIAKNSEADYKFLWYEAHKNIPVLVGEFGGVWAEGFSSDEDLAFIQKVIDNVNQNKLSYLAYTTNQEGELGLIDWESMRPTRKGEIIRKDLKIYPPTDFKY